MEFDTLPRLVKVDVIFRPEKIKFEVEKFYGWQLCNIINYYVDKAQEKQLTTHELLEFRRAILVSYEIQCIADRERFSV